MRSDAQGIGRGGSGEAGEISPAPPWPRLPNLTSKNPVQGGNGAAAHRGCETADSGVSKGRAAPPSPQRGRRSNEARAVATHA